MSYNIPQGLLAMLQSGALPSSIKVVSANPGGGSGSGSAPDGSWTNPYLTIQDAVDTMVAPVAGDPSTWLDQLYVMAGTYIENITLTQPKLMFIYVMGSVNIQGDITWDMSAPVLGVPSPVLSTFPFPMIGNSDNTLLEIDGNIIIKGDPNERLLWLQNTGAQIIQGENPSTPTAWAGSLNLNAFRSKFKSVQFGNEVTYEWSFKETLIEEGIFVGGDGVPSNRYIHFDNTDVTAGTFTPNGYAPQTASVWAPESNDSARMDSIPTIRRSRFYGDVNMGAFTMEDSAFGGAVTSIFINTIKDCQFYGVFTSTTSVDKILRCEFGDAVDLADVAAILDSNFQSTFSASDGNPGIGGCGFMGDVSLGNFGRILNSFFVGDFTVTGLMPGAPQGYVCSSIVVGAITLFDEANTFIDIATNDLTKRAGSAWGVAVVRLTDATP